MLTSPWGKVQHEYHDAPGVVFVSTAGHGGFKLDRAMNAMIPEPFRRPGGWYEEDCEASIVVYFLPVPAYADKKAEALRSIKNWFWQEWEKYTGETIPPGVSSQKDDHLWHQAHRERFVVCSALRIGPGVVGVKARRESDGAEDWFRVPEAEYKPPFAIDEARHQRSEVRLF